MKLVYFERQNETEPELLTEKEFINFVKDKNYCSRYIEDALETHKICNDIVKIIEDNN